ncbi:MAG: DUF3644 domain-containing protein [Deltaproteobacteria bacterium]|nr:DUF3644 domain-containing protein [Deltaproteobacteria bacterium]
MIAAVEIYNKPMFQYRDECFVILILNAWELVLKAIISKNGKSIYYRKKRHQPYRTLTWKDAFTKAESLFPEKIHPLPLRRNLELLNTFRDNAVHFYNETGFEVLIYALAQTNVVNFKDLLLSVFSVDLGSEMTCHLLPIGLSPPLDPIDYITARFDSNNNSSPAVKQFIKELARSTEELEDQNLDTGRLFTTFSVNLQSVKKIEKADVVVGVASPDETDELLLVHRRVDPNISHPLREKDVLDLLDNLHDSYSKIFVFRAIVWKYEIRNNRALCWKSDVGGLTKYSHDVVAHVKSLTQEEIIQSVNDFREYQNDKRAGRIR